MTVVYVAVAIAVLAFVIVRQLRPQPVTGRRIRIAAVLGVVGIAELVGVTSATVDPGALGWGLLLVGLVLGAAFGVWRAATMHLWFDGGRPFVQGHRATVALWIVGIAVHVGLDLLTGVLDPAAAPVNSASVMLFVAVTLGAQFLAIQRRVGSARPAVA